MVYNKINNMQKRKISILILILLPLSFFLLIYLQNLLNYKLTFIEIEAGKFVPKQLRLEQMAVVAIFLNILPNLLLFYFWFKILKFKSQDIGFIKPKLKPFIFWVLITSIMAIIYLMGSIFLKGKIEIDNHYQNIDKFLISFFLEMSPLVFLEEFIYRGLIFKIFSSRMNIFWTIVLQAIIFGLSHHMVSGTIAGISSMVVAGIILGLARYYSKSIWPGTVGHLINNFVVFYIR